MFYYLILILLWQFSAQAMGGSGTKLFNLIIYLFIYIILVQYII